MCRNTTSQGGQTQNRAEHSGIHSEEDRQPSLVSHVLLPSVVICGNYSYLSTQHKPAKPNAFLNQCSSEITMTQSLQQSAISSPLENRSQIRMTHADSVKSFRRNETHSQPLEYNHLLLPESLRKLAAVTDKVVFSFSRFVMRP